MGLSGEGGLGCSIAIVRDPDHKFQWENPTLELLHGRELVMKLSEDGKKARALSHKWCGAEIQFSQCKREDVLIFFGWSNVVMTRHGLLGHSIALLQLFWKPGCKQALNLQLLPPPPIKMM